MIKFSDVTKLSTRELLETYFSVSRIENRFISMTIDLDEGVYDMFYRDKDFIRGQYQEITNYCESCAVELERRTGIPEDDWDSYGEYEKRYDRYYDFIWLIRRLQSSEEAYRILENAGYVASDSYETPSFVNKHGWKYKPIEYFIPPVTRQVWSELYPEGDIDEIAVKIITSKDVNTPIDDYLSFFEDEVQE